MSVCQWEESESNNEQALGKEKGEKMSERKGEDGPAESRRESMVDRAQVALVPELINPDTHQYAATPAQYDPEAIKYSDEVFFDMIQQYIPTFGSGKWILLASLVLQFILVAFLFVGHHHRSRDFDCCNMWAVICVTGFLFLQWLYFHDWLSIMGENPMWHRANLFVPLNIFIIIFIEWGLGSFSMLAHAIDLNLLDATFSRLGAVEKASFVICTLTGIVIVICMFILSFVHRNNLGHYYYNKDERVGDFIAIQDSIIPVQGSFHFRGFLKKLVRKARVGTSKRAMENMSTLISVSTFLQMPFYIFCALTYASGNQSDFPIVFICIGVVVFAMHIPYWLGSLSPRTRRTRIWNREYLFFPILTNYVVLPCYAFIMSSVFFKNYAGAEIWESIIPNLDKSEKAYFGICFFLTIILFCVHMILAYVHRKGWSEGTDDIHLMLEAQATQAHKERSSRFKKKQLQEEQPEAETQLKQATLIVDGKPVIMHFSAKDAKSQRQGSENSLQTNDFSTIDSQTGMSYGISESKSSIKKSSSKGSMKKSSSKNRY